MNERTYNSGIDRLRSADRLERLEIDRVLDLCLKNKDIQSMLDVGTGSGIFAEAFHNRNIKTAGIDLNPEMLIAAKSHLPDGDFREAPAENIPFEDDSFDLVFMGAVFHEVSDYKAALNEAKRVAKKEIVMLEWPYVDQGFGPPIDHRLKEEFIQQLAQDAGFAAFEKIPLKQLVLYRLVK